MTAAIPYAHAIAAWQASAPAEPCDCPVLTDALLRDFHPDHQPAAMTTLRVGVSTGTRCPGVLAELLESDALVDDVDLAGAPLLDADVLVIGGGGAGCVAALCAARTGARVLLATKLRMSDGNTHGRGRHPGGDRPGR